MLLGLSRRNVRTYILCESARRYLGVCAAKSDAPACWPDTQNIPEVGLLNMEMVLRSWIGAGKTPILIDRTEVVLTVGSAHHVPRVRRIMSTRH